MCLILGLSELFLEFYIALLGSSQIQGHPRKVRNYII